VTVPLACSVYPATTEVGPIQGTGSGGGGGDPSSATRTELEVGPIQGTGSGGGGGDPSSATRTELEVGPIQGTGGGVGGGAGPSATRPGLSQVGASCHTSGTANATNTSRVTQTAFRKSIVPSFGGNGVPAPELTKVSRTPQANGRVCSVYIARVRLFDLREGGPRRLGASRSVAMLDIQLVAHGDVARVADAPATDATQYPYR